MTHSDDPTFRDHQAWLGALQPDGLVVSAAALVECQAALDRARLAPRQTQFLDHLTTVEHDDGTSVRAIRDLRRFLVDFLGWLPEHLVGLADAATPSPNTSAATPATSTATTATIPEDLRIVLADLGETLAPTFALRNPKAGDPRPADPAQSWLLLGQELPLGTDLDAPLDPERDARALNWNASPARRFERLLREARVPIGLLANGTELRLIHAPRGENAGSLAFPVAAMFDIRGRLILGALELLLDRFRLFTARSEERLPALLAKSRAIQANVSTELAGQVLDALYELVRGVQAADHRAAGALLRDYLGREGAHGADTVYHGLLTVLLRLVFLLYAEDRGLLPASALYTGSYGVHGLFERLRADAEQWADTLDHRFGAWAQLVALFRLVHTGHRHPALALPARHGHLFDPARFPFLEGNGGALPLVSDGVVYRVLRNLLVLGGERLSYRTLDVEQIGSVYQTMMGFRLERTTGPTIALKPKKRHGAPLPVDLGALLATKPTERGKWLKEHADRELSGNAAKALAAATNAEALLAVLDRAIARGATPQPLPAGALLLVPSDERRRSGSHYTPRSLTAPIVAKTLEPILAALGPAPRAEQILALAVCDPAMGSGAFLVEACRQLAEHLVAAWHRHHATPPIPPDEDELLHARRLIAQRCLYGVDKNPMAVDLAKLSLWLATLAKDHPFTFLDHALRAGDSLVGLSRDQIVRFHWGKGGQYRVGQERIAQRVERAAALRREILAAGDDLHPDAKRQKLAAADDLLAEIRAAGDLVLAAYSGAVKDREREARRDELLARLTTFEQTWDPALDPAPAIAELRSGAFPVTPFHWEIEFPELFDPNRPGHGPGFDAIVGNPPFAGKNTLAAGNHAAYPDWLKALHEESHGNADLVAHFFRRSFNLLRPNGSVGLIATNTIGQGDTRSTGLRWICTRGGTIYSATRRLKWPGEAAVVVSVVHLLRGTLPPPFLLDGREVPIITAYLFHAGGHEDPERLAANEGKSFIGSYVLGMGFTFDDTDKKGVASPLAEMHRLIAKDPHNAERIFPYIGGEEVNDSPTHAHHRYVINFGDMSEEEARRWPDLMAIVEERVKPERDKLRGNADADRRRDRWWLWGRYTPALFDAIQGLDRVLAIARVSQCAGFASLDSRTIFSEQLVVVAIDSHAAFAILQSRPHELWARFFGSSMKDDLRYTPSDCFETFPFPPDWESNAAVEAAGRTYYDFRAALMVRNDEGLTKTYNRFHDPEERSADIQHLRDLHAAMDRAVLDAYGWTNISTDCDFRLDYDDEDDEDDTAKRRRKKPWRLRWPDEARDEVLARLLALNAERAQQERLAGLAPGRRRSQEPVTEGGA